MRPVPILLALLALGLATWHALFSVAPGIEREIDRRAEAALEEATRHPLAISTRGRTVRVAGLADGEAERRALIARVAALPGVEAVEDRIRVLPRSEPYRFRAEKRPEAPLRLSGDMPSAAAETAILDRARGVATGTTVVSALGLAAGLPDPGWTDSVARALSALGPLIEARIEIEGLAGRVEGRAASPAKRDAAAAILAGDPLIDWTAEIGLRLPVAAPYVFEVEKTASGAVTYAGHAPGEHVERRFEDALARLGPDGASGEITLAAGMPSNDWPLRVTRGIEALGALRFGRFALEGEAASLTGIATTPEAEAEARDRAPEATEVAISVLDPTPAAAMEIAVSPEGWTLEAARLPAGLDRDAIADALPELSGGAAIETGGRGDPAAWREALQALAIVLPRLARGTATLGEARLAISGTLRDGFSASETRTALRSVAALETEVDLAEAPPAAALDIRKAGERPTISGILPEGLSAEAALVRFGGASSGGVTSGGAGDPRGWRSAIDAVAKLLPAYDSLRARIAEETVAVEGRLAPGQALDEIDAAVAGALDEGWTMELGGTETAAPPGTLRTDIATGARQRLAETGHWLPILRFEPDREGCERALGEALDGAAVLAETGAGLAKGARPAVDRLAAVVLRCADEGGLRLRLATESDPESGEAGAALGAALAERGVPYERLDFDTAPASPDAAATLGDAIALSWTRMPPAPPPTGPVPQASDGPPRPPAPARRAPGVAGAQDLAVTGTGDAAALPAQPSRAPSGAPKPLTRRAAPQPLPAEEVSR